MLTFMRKHAKSWLIKVLLGTVIVVFIFFYGFNLRQKSASVVASVNGVKISIQQLKSQYQRLLQYQPQRASLTSEQLRALKEAALEHLIDQVLLLEQAERWEISVSDTEVTTQIHQIPAFLEDGQFVYARFQQILRFQGLTEESFLEDMRRSLLIQKTQDLIRDSAKAAEEDVAALYRLFNERMVLQYISLGPEQFEAQVTISEDEMPDPKTRCRISSRIISMTIVCPRKCV
jgi:peptidyl-prolyl cis-trans isomerase D